MTHIFHAQIARALGTQNAPDVAVSQVSQAHWPAWFDVSELAVASVSAAAAEAAALLGATKVQIDRYLTLKWFDMTLRPIGWSLPAAWDAIAGDYATTDGWIRLHSNAPHHRAAALEVLGCAPTREGVAAAVASWEKSALEQQVVAAQGAAAAMHSLEAWAAHPQGASVAAEPLIDWQQTGTASRDVALQGLRVLDLTRVLAGPVATRFLAGYGADVLRIDPPDWEEPAVAPEVTLGKRCAALDLTRTADRQRFETLLQQADVLVHGYRPGALEGLGYGRLDRQRIAPEMIEVSLNAYGHNGPWAARRGFDSLVQMSCGIADAGMCQSGQPQPVPLPVQALDHATGYLMAAAVLRAVRVRQGTGQIYAARLSLARTGAMLTGAGVQTHKAQIADETPGDMAHEVEQTGWGPAHRVQFPVEIVGQRVAWPHPSGPLKRAQATW